MKIIQPGGNFPGGNISTKVEVFYPRWELKIIIIMSYVGHRMRQPCSLPERYDQCGITDSLQKLLYHANFIKPYSDEKYLVYLLAKSF